MKEKEELEKLTIDERLKEVKRELFQSIRENYHLKHGKVNEEKVLEEFNKKKKEITTPGKDVIS